MASEIPAWQMVPENKMELLQRWKTCKVCVVCAGVFPCRCVLGNVSSGIIQFNKVLEDPGDM